MTQSFKASLTMKHLNTRTQQLPYSSLHCLFLCFTLILTGSITRGQSCSNNAVFPRTFGMTTALPDRFITDHKMAYVAEIDTLVVASKTNYDP